MLTQRELANLDECLSLLKNKALVLYALESNLTDLPGRQVLADVAKQYEGYFADLSKHLNHGQPLHISG